MPLVTPLTIYDLSVPRNPYLMEALYYMKFVKGVHEGTRRMRDTMAEMKLPHPEFEQKDFNYALVRVTLRNDIARRKKWIDRDASALIGAAISNMLDQHELRVINFIAENSQISVSQAQRLTGKSWPAASKTLKGLVDRGILEAVRKAGAERDPSARYKLRTPRQNGNENGNGM
jgi:ATP-dependent DNA helicase RecG